MNMSIEAYQNSSLNMPDEVTPAKNMKLLNSSDSEHEEEVDLKIIL